MTPSPMKFYIASGLENAGQVAELRDILTSLGGQVTYDWTLHGSVQDQGPDRIAEVAGLEAAGVIDADMVIVLLPGGRGTHVELGMAIGNLTPVLLHGPLVGPDGRECAFYRHPLVIDHYDSRCSLRSLAAVAMSWWGMRETPTEEAPEPYPFHLIRVGGSVAAEPATAIFETRPKLTHKGIEELTEYEYALHIHLPPNLRAARSAIGLSLDELAERVVPVHHHFGRADDCPDPACHHDFRRQPT